jgi:hypothetical protein
MLGDTKKGIEEVFAFCLQRGCGITFVGDGMVIVPQRILEELDRNGLDFEPAELSPEQAKEARILEAVSGRF